MKFSTDKKQTIILYLLDKISNNTQSISKVVADAFNISQNTVHTYINELLSNNVIKKGKRGQYELVTTQFEYDLKRSNGDLNADIHVYNVCLDQHIRSLADNIQDIWSYAFTEMVNNVIDHSEAENLNVVIIQDYLRTHVIIADDGMGIFEKIKNHFSLPNLDEAICELFKGKLTTDEKNHSGEGIFFTSKMMDTFLISSSGKIFTTSNYSNDHILNMNESFSGTCVFMSLSNFTHKQAHEVFDLYASIDGGFTKTRIPLKNIFDSAPVSRSQAKRVCNRLDRFEQVTLDFDEIGWMGQGFAHQLFVVYQNAHPQIILCPINMNESVTKMYNHVLNSAQG